MPAPGIRRLLETAYCGRLGTVGPEGWPYVCPLLFVWRDERIWVHRTGDGGHLRRNLQHSARVCFEIDEPGEVFPYGRFDCDTALAYRSLVAFGTAGRTEDAAAKAGFFDALMAKYFNGDAGRPRGFYPRLDQVEVYAIEVERLTGKETPLPAPDAQWPALDRTRSPGAVPPGRPG